MALTFGLQLGFHEISPRGLPVPERNMTKRNTIGGLLLLCITLSVPARGESCSSLNTLKLPNTAITSAEDIGAGKFAPPEGSRLVDLRLPAYRDLPAFC